MQINRRDKEFIEHVRESRKHCMKPASYKDKEEVYLNWLLPIQYYNHELGWRKSDGRCIMNTKDKNLWITGTKEQCEKFIKDAIGDDKYLVYNKNKFHWNNYFGQPFIVLRVYNKSQRAKRVYTLRRLGDWAGFFIEKQKSFHELSPNLYHCIVLSTFSPKEYCKGAFGPDHDEDQAGSLEWRFDVLDLREREMQKIEL